MAIPDTRLHPIYLVIETAKTLRSAIPFLVVTILGGAPWWVNAILFALIMVVAVAQWHVKKYSVISGVLRLRSGLVNRSVRVVPITRITALAASQSLTQRLVGVWRLNVQSPGDRNGSALILGCLSGSRLDELRDALESGHLPERATRAGTGARPGSTIRRSAERRFSGILPGGGPPRCGSTRRHRGPADLGNADRRRHQQLDSADLCWCAGGVVPVLAIRPEPCRGLHERDLEPRGIVAVLVALIVVAVVGGVVLGALRLNQFTLIRDGDVLRNSRGLLGNNQRPSRSSGSRPSASSRASGGRRSAIARCRSRWPGSAGRTPTSACSFR